MIKLFENRYMVEDKFTRKVQSWSVKYQENGKDVIDTFEVRIIKNLELIQKINLIHGY